MRIIEGTAREDTARTPAAIDAPRVGAYEKSMLGRAACLAVGLLLLVGCPESEGPVDDIVMGEEEVASLQPDIEPMCTSLHCCTAEDMSTVAKLAASKGQYCDAPGVEYVFTGSFRNQFAPGLDVCEAPHGQTFGYAIPCDSLQ